MPTPLEELELTVAILPIMERAELAQFLLDTLDDVNESAADEWLEVARQQLQELHTGNELGLPAEQVLESMRRPRS